MRENPKYKKAAILFADIVSYTSLMQKDPQSALFKLASFKKLLEIKTSSHQGQIIQFHGDGCLVTFENTLSALTCVKELQEALRAEAAIPIRIGLHEEKAIFPLLTTLL